MIAWITSGIVIPGVYPRVGGAGSCPLGLKDVFQGKTEILPRGIGCGLVDCGDGLIAVSQLLDRLESGRSIPFPGANVPIGQAQEVARTIGAGVPKNRMTPKRSHVDFQWRFRQRCSHCRYCALLTRFPPAIGSSGVARSRIDEDNLKIRSLEISKCLFAAKQLPIVLMGRDVKHDLILLDVNNLKRCWRAGVGAMVLAGEEEVRYHQGNNVALGEPPVRASVPRCGRTAWPPATAAPYFWPPADAPNPH